MDETTRGIIAGITVRCDKPMPLPGGRECRVFYDCPRLTPNDLVRLAAGAVGDVDEHAFDSVVGIAYNGILFSAAVARGKQVTILQTDGQLWGPPVNGRKVVVVDDVVFTGSRVREAVQRLTLGGATVVACACIVDRSEGAYRADGFPIWSAFQTVME